MKNYLYWLPLLASSTISLALQGPGLWARLPNRDDVVELGGLRSRVPADWVEEKPDDAHCYKQYRLEPVLPQTVRGLGEGVQVVEAGKCALGWRRESVESGYGHAQGTLRSRLSASSKRGWISSNLSRWVTASAVRTSG